MDTPRLDGDRLVAWVRLIVEEEQLVQRKQMLASQFLRELGYTPGEHLLSDDAYIVTPEEAREALRIQTIPATPPQDERPQILDSAT